MLFASQRAVFSSRHSQFFTVGTGGGVPQALPIPTGDKGAISPDGKFLAYTPLGERFRQWKNYRGGTASRIWVLKLADLSHVEIPKPPAGCNDTDPMWIGQTVYFLSDRDGEFNLYSYDPATKKVDRHTEHADFPIGDASAGAGKVIYEQAGYLHVFEPGASQPTRLKIGVAADLAETRPRRYSNVKAIRSADISPTGKRVVLEYRGEIVTVPAKKGDPRNLTRDARRSRALAGLVARRQVDRLLLRRLGRVRPARPAPGRQGRGPRLRAEGGGLLRAARLVARQQEDRLHRQLPHALLDRPRRPAPSSGSAPSRSTARSRP